MSNRVFYQHPNLMRALGMHETVMEVMVNVLGGGDSKVNMKFTIMTKNLTLNLNWLFVLTGDQVPSSGDKLLSLSLLLLSHQSSEPALHV